MTQHEAYFSRHLCLSESHCLRVENGLDPSQDDPIRYVIESGDESEGRWPQDPAGAASDLDVRLIDHDAIRQLADPNPPVDRQARKALQLQIDNRVRNAPCGLSRSLEL